MGDNSRVGRVPQAAAAGRRREAAYVHDRDVGPGSVSRIGARVCSPSTWCSLNVPGLLWKDRAAEGPSILVPTCDASEASAMARSVEESLMRRRWGTGGDMLPTGVSHTRSRAGADRARMIPWTSHMPEGAKSNWRESQGLDPR